MTKEGQPQLLKGILTVTAVVLSVLGGGLLFANHWMAVMYGATESVSGTNGGRTAGAAIFALGILAWLGARQTVKVIRRVVLPVLFTWFVFKSVLAYQALIGGVFKPPVARTVLIFDILLAVVFGYFLLATRSVGQAGE